MRMGSGPLRQSQEEVRWKSRARSMEGREGRDTQMFYISPHIRPSYSSTPSP